MIDSRLVVANMQDPRAGMLPGTWALWDSWVPFFILCHTCALLPREPREPPSAAATRHAPKGLAAYTSDRFIAVFCCARGGSRARADGLSLSPACTREGERVAHSGASLCVRRANASRGQLANSTNRDVRSGLSWLTRNHVRVLPPHEGSCASRAERRLSAV